MKKQAKTKTKASDQAANNQFEDAVDIVHSILAEDASYFAPPSTKRLRYAPDASLFDLLVWNVVIAFWVNVAASWFFDAYRRAQEPDESEDLKKRVQELERQLAAANEKLLSKDDCVKMLCETNSVLASLKTQPVTVVQLNVSITQVKAILMTYGLPEQQAQTKAEEVAAKLKSSVGDSNATNS